MTLEAVYGDKVRCLGDYLATTRAAQRPTWVDLVLLEDFPGLEEFLPSKKENCHRIYNGIQTR